MGGADAAFATIVKSENGYSLIENDKFVNVRWRRTQRWPKLNLRESN